MKKLAALSLLTMLALAALLSGQTGRYTDSLHGLLHEASGAVVVAPEQSGAYVNSFGFRVNPDNSLVLSGGEALLYAVGTLQVPATPTVTPTCDGTCASTWGYKVVAFDTYGNQMSAPTAQGATTAQAATLTLTRYNTVTWTAVTGAASYNVYRTAHATAPTQDSLVCTAVTQAAGCKDDGTVTTASATPGIIVGTADDVAFCSYTVPGGTMGKGRCLRVTADWIHSTGSANATYKGFYSTGAFVTSAVSAAVTELNMSTLVCNNPGVTGTQYGTSQGGPLVFTPAATSIDSTADKTLSATFSVANTDAITPKACRFELIQ